VSPRTGRRPGDSGARDAILAAARRRFADHGFDRATIRAIAGDAGVDPALVHHYFGTKRDLFSASLELPFDPGAMVAELVTGPRTDLGPRLVAAFLAGWDRPGAASPMIALLRSAMADEGAATMARQVLYDRILHPVATAIGSPDAEFRASLAAAQMTGLAIGRYIIAIPPLATAPVDDIVRAVGPTLQRYLVGEW